MPLYEYQCAAGHRTEHYEPSAAQAPTVRDCRQCDGLARRVPSVFQAPQFFSESSPRVIANIDRDVAITSPAQHERLMREHGLSPATQWHTSAHKRTDGLKTGNVYPVGKAIA